MKFHRSTVSLISLASTTFGTFGRLYIGWSPCITKPEKSYHLMLKTLLGSTCNVYYEGKGEIYTMLSLCNSDIIITTNLCISL